MAIWIEAISREMQRKNLSHTALARAAGVGRPYLYRVLAGTQVPTVDWLERVLAQLGLELRISKKKQNSPCIAVPDRV